MPTMPHDDSCDATGADVSGSPYSEVSIVVSDTHLGEGRRVRVEYDGRRGIGRAWRALARVVLRQGDKFQEIDNPLDDFQLDSEFADFLDMMGERYAGADSVRLRLLGDIFDPLIVAWQGRYVDPPYESVGAYKMIRIIEGHTPFFDALGRFIRRANCRIDVFTGNHDLFLAWPSVRALLLDRICGGNPELLGKVDFVDHKHGFRTLDKGVLYEHGNNAEAHNRVDPENAVVRDVLGVTLRQPILNAPYGSYMCVDLAIPLKLRNGLVGRLREDRRVWTHAFRHRWLWGAYALVRLIWHFIYAHFFAFWDFRRKANSRKILDIVLATTTKNPVDRYAMQLLRERDDARVVVLGHSHHWRRLSSAHGTYLNTGNWTVAYRMYQREFERTWKSLEWLEPYWRSLRHFFRTGEMRFASRMIRFTGVLAFIAALSTFAIFGLWPLDTLQVKALAVILLIFVVVAGVFKMFSVEPKIVDDTRLTFGLIRHRKDGSLQADLMEYLPEEKDFREPDKKDFHESA